MVLITYFHFFQLCSSIAIQVEKTVVVFLLSVLATSYFIFPNSVQVVVSMRLTTCMLWLDIDILSLRT